MRSLSYFLMGLGAGAAVGVLYSPMSGADTRGFLKNKAQDGADYLKNTAMAGIERGKEATITPIQEAVEAGKQAYQEALAKSAPKASV